MSTIKEIESAISKLSREDQAVLRQWFAEFDAKQEAASKNGAWATVNEFRERLASSGRDFGDSTEHVREDRDR